MATEERVYVFSNGSEYEMWDAYNCARCWKVHIDTVEELPYSQCAIWKGINLDGWTEGAIRKSIADRMGYGPPPHRIVWRCPEYEAKRPYKPRKALRGRQLMEELL